MSQPCLFILISCSRTSCRWPRCVWGWRSEAGATTPAIRHGRMGDSRLLSGDTRQFSSHRNSLRGEGGTLGTAFRIFGGHYEWLSGAQPHSPAAFSSQHSDPGLFVWPRLPHSPGCVVYKVDCHARRHSQWGLVMAEAATRAMAARSQSATLHSAGRRNSGPGNDAIAPNFLSTTPVGRCPLRVSVRDQQTGS